MTKWPERWLAALRYTVLPGLPINEDRFNQILTELEYAGALKTPPPPLEIYWCPVCNSIRKEPGDHAAACAGPRVLMRQVTE